MLFFTHDNISFHYVHKGRGLPVVFQHGIGGDVEQSVAMFEPPQGFSLLACDARGHGKTTPLGDTEKLSIPTFADDLRTLLDHAGIPAAVIGGVSMGAAVALSFAMQYPQQVLALILSRPAWLDEPLPANLTMYPRIAQLIHRHGAREGLRRFQLSWDYQDIQRRSPASGASLLKQFERERAEETAAILDRLPESKPAGTWSDWGSLDTPTLIMAGRQDLIHPYAYGETLANTIPDAEFQELTPKSVSPKQHAADVQRFMTAFLELHLGTRWGDGT